ncbi:MAG: IdeS/Mac family cysteine endopeptidase [Peptostreptococcaceae bacterium]|nr:IdeS/Mac family cysteine endopeptidase [Peptostreptococcaceae bacterium]
MTTALKRLRSIFLIVILLLTQLSFKGYAATVPLPQTADRQVAANKVFTIRFNDIINKGNLRPGNIRVTDEDGDVGIFVENGSDGKSLTISPPAEGYLPGRIYILHIQGLTNDKGKSLKIPVQMSFIIEAAEEKKPEEDSPAPLPDASPSSPVLPAPSVPSPAPPSPSAPPEVSVEDFPADSPSSSEKSLSPADTEVNEGLTAPEKDQKEEEPSSDPSPENVVTDPLSEETTSEETLPPTPSEKEASPLPSPSRPQVPEKRLPDAELPVPSPEGALASLTAGVNKNAVQYRFRKDEEREEVHTVLWVKGIAAPALSEFTEVRDGDYLVRQTPYQSGRGWYDVNKAKDGSFHVQDDAYLCFAAVAANMLHWWFEQNQDHITDYITDQEKLLSASETSKESSGIETTKSEAYPPLTREKLEMLKSLRDSFRDQQDSEIFKKFTREFGHLKSGFQADLLVDMLVNGYEPKDSKIPGSGAPVNDDEYEETTKVLAAKIDPRGGLFYPVLGPKKVTSRTAGTGEFSSFERDVKSAMSQGCMIGLAYRIGNRDVGHIVTVWGAEFDSWGRLVAFYISDSDDQNEGTKVGMKRLEVRNVDNRPKLGSNQADMRAGSPIDHMHIMHLREDLWSNYFSKSSN